MKLMKRFLSIVLAVCTAASLAVTAHAETTTKIKIDDSRFEGKTWEEVVTQYMIEHDLDVLKTAGHLIDLGPEGGDGGGYIVAEGTPEQLADNPDSVTGPFLKEILQNYGEYQSNGKTVQCWLEDVASIKVKLQVMNAQQIAGVAAWKLGLEDTSVWEVMEQYTNGTLH